MQWRGFSTPIPLHFFCFVGITNKIYAQKSFYIQKSVGKRPAYTTTTKVSNSPSLFLLQRNWLKSVIRLDANMRICSSEVEQRQKDSQKPS